MSLPRLLKKSLPSLKQLRKNSQDARTRAAPEVQDMSEQRNLSEEERVLLAFVLANGKEAAKSFLHQVAGARVISRCRCGCPTIGLEVDRSLSAGSSAEGRVIVDLLGRTPDGKQVGLLVFADNGFLSELEIYDLDELVRPYPLPTLESLLPFESSQH